MINRRDFIRTSVLAGGALFAQTAIPSGAADATGPPARGEGRGWRPLTRGCHRQVTGD